MHIKLNDLTLNNISKDGFTAKLENVYSQAKRTNTLKMVKVLIGQIFTVSVTLHNVTSDMMRRIQTIALLPEISVEFYDEEKSGYRTENMYCETINKTVTRELKNGTMFYKEVTLNFIGNERVIR